jgi:hypothetical protein
MIGANREVIEMDAFQAVLGHLEGKCRRTAYHCGKSNGVKWGMVLRTCKCRNWGADSPLRRFGASIHDFILTAENLENEKQFPHLLQAVSL